MTSKKYLWLLGWFLLLCLVLFLTYISTNDSTAGLFRDYLLIALVIVSGEVLGRMIHGISVKGGCTLYFLPRLREELLVELQNKIIERKFPHETTSDIADLTKSSITMLGVMSSITMTLAVLAISISTEYEHLTRTALTIFTASSFLTFTVFLVNLTLCYTLIEPSIKRNTEFLIKGVRKYYYLTMFGLILLGITFAWGVYVFTPLFHPETLTGKISLCVLFFVLVILYLLVFMVKKLKD